MSYQAYLHISFSLAQMGSYISCVTSPNTKFACSWQMSMSSPEYYPLVYFTTLSCLCCTVICSALSCFPQMSLNILHRCTVASYTVHCCPVPVGLRQCFMAAMFPCAEQNGCSLNSQILFLACSPSCTRCFETALNFKTSCMS